MTTLTYNLQPVCHIHDDWNPADVGTRGLVGVGDLGPGSAWQVGPAFLLRNFSDWPRDSGDVLTRDSVPPEECCVAASNMHATQGDKGPTNLLEKLVEAAGEEDKLGGVLSKLCVEVLWREKLELTVRVLARVLSTAVMGCRTRCRQPPAVQMVEVAVRVLLKSASGSAREALKAGKLRGLGGEVHGCVVWVTGRIRGEQLATLLGTTALPVLLASEPLAVALLHKSHHEDHRRGPRDAAAG